MARLDTQNPWLAIDAATPPARRALELRRDWERFISGGGVSGVRSPVAESWRRSLDAGVDPSGGRLAAVASDREEASEHWQAHPLAEAAPLIRDCLASIAVESDELIVVSDAAGMLLALEGSTKVRSLAADSMNFTEGALWSETSAGTNAIGTALAADHAVQIFATEHFVEPVQAWTCAAAPVHDPETGELIGVIDVTGLKKHVHPHTLAIVMTTARAVESHLRRLQQERGRRRARRDELGQLAEEQAALRRLATAVARGVPPAQIFRAVAEEVGPLLGADDAAVVRFEADRTATVVAGVGVWAEEVERRVERDDSAAITEVFRTGRSVRVDRRDRSTASGPLRPPASRREPIGGGEPDRGGGSSWGAMIASTRRQPLPADIEKRMAHFTELVGSSGCQCRESSRADGLARPRGGRRRHGAPADSARPA